MNLLQPVEQRIEHAFDGGRLQQTATPDTLIKRFTAGQRHHHVSSAVGFEKIDNSYNRRRRLELRERACLFEKALATPDKFLD